MFKENWNLQDTAGGREETMLVEHICSTPPASSALVPQFRTGSRMENMGLRLLSGSWVYIIHPAT